MDDELVIRPARAGDRAAVERICAHTWEWGDYIPEVWEAWLADERGALFAGELGAEVVAVNRILFPAPDQAWLEGMRVDPEYRRRGIARRFLAHALAYARQRGARVARLATGDYNEAVHAMVTQAGMERVGSYLDWTAEPLAEGPLPTFLRVEQAPQAMAFLAQSEVMAECHGLYSAEWAWQELSAGRVMALLAGGCVAAEPGREGEPAALAVVTADPGEEAAWIGFGDGEPAALARLARGLRAHAARSGARRARALLPSVAWLREAYGRAGYSQGDWQGELWVFERQLGGESGEANDG